MRIQRKRLKGWRQPPNTRYCGRGTKYGNQHKIIVTLDGWVVDGVKFQTRYDAQKYSVEKYKMDVLEELKRNPAYFDELKGYENLSCFCPLEMPCHVDAIIEFLSSP